MNGKRIVGVLLAAGKGERFGGDKLLAPLPAPSHGVPAGTPIGVASALHLAQALREVVAVVRPGDDALAAALAQAGVRVIACERAHEGMGASLAGGVAAVADADGWVVALGDMPWLAPATIAAIATTVAAGATIAAARHRGQRGHPVGFGEAMRQDLTQLAGDEGARHLLAAHAADTVLLDLDDPGIVRDVDHADDLAPPGVNDVSSSRRCSS